MTTKEVCTKIIDHVLNYADNTKDKKKAIAILKQVRDIFKEELEIKPSESAA